MKIAIGYDPNAVALKDTLLDVCRSLGHEVQDFGGSDPIYAHTAIAVGEAVAAGDYERGILICGTGIGMSIAANKVKGVYAALLTDVYSAKRAILSNNSNIACLGAFTVGAKLAEELIRAWLSCEFEEGCASQPKVDCYYEYDVTSRYVQREGE